MRKKQSHLLPALFVISVIVICLGFIILSIYLRNPNKYQSLRHNLSPQTSTQNHTQDEISAFISSLYGNKQPTTTVTPPDSPLQSPTPTSPSATGGPSPTGVNLTPITSPTVTPTPNLTPANTNLPNVTFAAPSPTPTPAVTPSADCTTSPYSICYFDLDNWSGPMDQARYAPVDSNTKDTITTAFNDLNLKASIVADYAVVIMQNKDYGGMNVNVITSQLSRPVGTLEYQEQVSVDNSHYKVIQLNTNLSGGNLNAVTCHAIGKVAWPLLTSEEQADYGNLRDVENTEGLIDDFGEVFKYVFGNHNRGGSLWDVRTSSGNPDPATTSFMEQTVAPKFQQA